MKKNKPISNSVSVDLDGPIHFLLKEGKWDMSDADYGMPYEFCMSGRIAINFDPPSVDSVDTDTIDRCYVIKLCDYGRKVCVNERKKYEYYLNPEGYAFIRPRLVEYLRKHKATNRNNDIITIEMVDAFFYAGWNTLKENTEKEWEKMKLQFDLLNSIRKQMMD